MIMNPLEEGVSRWINQKYNIQVSSSWVKACIRWIIEENRERESDTDEICHLVDDQLIHSDLEEVVQLGSLRHNDLQQKGIIEGLFLIQVYSAVDVSCSAYNTLQKLKSGERLAQDSNRVLILEASDGQSTFRVMEYHYIPHIDYYIKPGSKLLLEGKIQYNLGMLLASKENISLLGGGTEGRKGLETQLYKLLCGDELSENAELKKPYSYEDCHRVSTVFINDASGDTSKEAVNTGVLKYLKELQYLDWTQHPEVGVKASFYSINNKIHCSSQQWMATINIQDEEKTIIEVSISNEILEELIGFSAVIFTNSICLKKSETAIRKMARKRFSFCQSVISSINCFIVLQKKKSCIPCIVKLLQR